MDAQPRKSVVIFATLILGLCLPSRGSSQDRDKANEAIRRLPPSAFPELPAPINRYLQRRGCTVPQVDERPRNVLRGHFTSAHQTDWDWAVLCSAHRVSTILVFRNGSTARIAEIASRDDENDREIDVAPPTVLEGYRLRYKDLSLRNGDPPSWYPKGGFDHDGVEDATEKGSALYYWSGKYWFNFPGAD